MNRQLSLTLATLLTICSLLLSGAVAEATWLTSPDPQYFDALWIAENDGVLKVAAADGTILFEVTDIGSVRAVAVEVREARVWALADQTLRAFDFLGQALVAVPLPGGSGTVHAALEVSADDGSAWLGVGKTLYHFDPAGQLLGEFELAENVVALAFDEQRSWLWVGTDKQVSAIDGSGALMAVVDLSENPHVKDLDHNAETSELWVALSSSLRRYGADLTLLADLPISNLLLVETDLDGGAWLATNRDLTRMDTDGSIAFTMEPFQGGGVMVDLAVDLSDSSVWAATQTKVAHVDTQGQLLHELLLAGSAHIRDLDIYVDYIAPEIHFLLPPDGACLDTLTPSMEVEYSDVGSGVDVESLQVLLNGGAFDLNCTADDVSATCTPTSPLPEGELILSATVQDFAGNVSEAAEVTITIDVTAPEITVTSPVDGLVTNQSEQTIVGLLSEAAVFTIDGSDVPVLPDNTFEHGPIILPEGTSHLHLVAEDCAGNQGERYLTITIDTIPPDPVNPELLTVTGPTPGQVSVIAAPTAAEPGTTVSVTNTRTSEVVTITVAADGSFSVTLAGQAGDELDIVLTDEAGNPSATTTVIVEGGGPSDLPPDPSTVAPPLDPTVPVDLYDSTEFLYTGDDPIQTGVQPGTIEPRRVAILRGRVLNRANNPLPGVQISILDHPEYGQTLSRADGVFDLAVNGGGVLVVEYHKDGYLPVQRRAEPAWQGWEWLPDVVMITLDQQVSILDLSSPAIQVAQGSQVTDQDGTRLGILIAKPGTTATLNLSDGTSQPITQLSVRLTEYTVGDNGPEAMPAELPDNVAYTYCVEMSADEANAAGATSVSFSQPLYYYLDNFLHFFTGTIIPAGWYDNEVAGWIASDDGRTIEILGIQNGIAQVDVDGSGIPADETTLAEMGFDQAELEQLAVLYSPGQSLWRVPVPHFSEWDFNMPYGPPDEARGPNPPPPLDHDPEDDPCEDCGCVIEIQNQVLGETIPLVGTPHSLHYRSDRVPGYKNAMTLHIPLSGEEIIPSVKRIDVEVSFGGRLFTASHPAGPNQSHIFAWDGLDAYGRPVHSAQDIEVSVGWVYDGIYYDPYTFPRRSWVASWGHNTFYGAPATTDPTRLEVTLWRTTTATIAQGQTTVGTWDARGVGLGGWSLTSHHVYDPTSETLFMGNGQRSHELNLRGPILARPRKVEIGDGGLATEAGLFRPMGITVGPDDNFYLPDAANNRIRRVGHDGVIETVAGVGTTNWNQGDGGPATDAYLYIPRDVSVAADGSFYFTDEYFYTIRKVGPDGIIGTVAGKWSYNTGCPDEGVPATNTRLGRPVAVAADHSNGFYIADFLCSRIYHVDDDGIIRTFAGSGAGYSGDGWPAETAQLNHPTDVEVGPDGTVYIVDQGNHCIRKVDPEGLIHTIAGTGQAGFSGDGGPAAQAQFDIPYSLAIGADGSLFVADRGNHRIRRIGIDGIIGTVAGNGVEGYSENGGVATETPLYRPYFVAVAPDGTFYFSETYADRIRQVQGDGIIQAFAGVGTVVFPTKAGPAEDVPMPPWPDVERKQTPEEEPEEDSSKLLVIAPGDPDSSYVVSKDGSLIYIFSRQGRHQYTYNALTGLLLKTYHYDDEGYLIGIEDADQNLTTIERDGSGTPLAIVSPYGQRTELTLNTDGFLELVTNPAEETISLGYTAEGLLTGETDARENSSIFSYNTAGELISDEDANGGILTLDRSDLGTWYWNRGYEIEKTSREGRITEYSVVKEYRDGSPEWVWRITEGGCDTCVSEERRRGSTRIRTARDGTTTTTITGVDQRMGLNGRPPAVTVTTPSGLTSTTTYQRHVVRHPQIPLGAGYQQDMVSVNERNYIRKYYKYYSGPATVTTTSPEGRQTTTTIDEQGRVQNESFPSLADVTYLYDTDGRLESVSQGSRTWILTYDASGYVGSVSDPTGRTTGFEYDDAGRVTTQFLPGASRTVKYKHDANGNITAITPPGRPDHDFTHTLVNLQESYTPPDVNIGETTTSFFYNLDSQIELISRPDQKNIDFEYDSTGRLSTITMAKGDLIFTYDEFSGRPLNILAPGGESLHFTWDGFLKKSVSWSGSIQGSVSHAHDDNFWITSTTVNGTDTVDYVRDNDGFLLQAGDLVISRQADNGRVTGTSLGSVNESRTYNEYGEVESFNVTGLAGSLFATEYVRDQLGRILQKVETIEGLPDTYDYVYDDIGRLVTSTKNGALTTTYVYDVTGNRLAKNGQFGSEYGTYDDQDRLLNYGECTYSYSKNGELESKTCGAETTTYSYDAFGNLLHVSTHDGTEIEYAIDAKNRRVGKKINGLLIQGFLYNNQLSPAAELDGAGNVIARFVYAEKANVPAHMIKGGITYRIVSDNLGSVRMVVDSITGEVAQRIDYDEFGVITYDSNQGFQPFAFAGGIYDPHTRLVRFGWRDYDADIGRWTSKDPVKLAKYVFRGASAGLYEYCKNDPVNNIDPTGLEPCPDSDPGMGPWLLAAGFVAVLDTPAPGPADAVAGGILITGWLVQLITLALEEPQECEEEKEEEGDCVLVGPPTPAIPEEVGGQGFWECVYKCPDDTVFSMFVTNPAACRPIPWRPPPTN